MERKSLAYRNNEQAIWDGSPPEKYRRLMPFITGDRILELGAAEGVLSLMLARSRSRVIGLEMRRERHVDALRLKGRWAELGRDVKSCEMVLGNILEHLDLLEGIDTLVAVRSIYYLRRDACRVLSAAAQHVPQVVMCGNRNRAAAYWATATGPEDGLGRWNYFASAEGMIQLLEEAGYGVTKVVREGDPIVVGRMRPLGR